MFKVKRYNVSYLSDPTDIISISVKAPITVEEVTPGNVDHVIDFQPEKYTAIFNRLLKEDQCGVYAVEDSKVVGHAWAIVCHDKRGRSVGYYDLHAGEALIHYCEVESSRRGCGIYPAMLFSLCKRLFNEEGISKVFANTEIDNIAALRSIAKVGFKTAGRYLFLRFRGRLVYKKELV